MRWRQGRRSTNVEDRRGTRMGRAAMPAAGVGGGALLLIVLVSLLLGQDPSELLNQVAQSPGAAGDTQMAAPPDEAADFVSVVLADTEDTWGSLFTDSGLTYEQPRLVLYTDVTQTACGLGSAATGPFYCPNDEKVYLDLGFFRQLQQLGATGDFAVAYVIAHEIGHHVQKVTGIEPEVRRLRSRASQQDANALSVTMELQADCYAGVWAHFADKQRDMLDAGDIEAGMNAAAAVGDDRLQRMSGRAVQPDAFTHGSSKQRAQWFRTGLETGDVDACDTFAAAGLRQ